MDILFNYMVFNLPIPTWCGTSPHTCTTTISSLSISLIYMVASPSSESHFLTRVFPWWPLEFTCSGYLHRRSTYGTYFLACMHGLTRQEDFRYKGSSCPWSHYCHLSHLRRSQSWTISVDTNCCATEGAKPRRFIPMSHE